MNDITPVSDTVTNLGSYLGLFGNFGYGFKILEMKK